MIPIPARLPNVREALYCGPSENRSVLVPYIGAFLSSQGVQYGRHRCERWRLVIPDITKKLHTFGQQCLILIKRYQVGQQHEQFRPIFRLNEPLVFEQVRNFF